MSKQKVDQRIDAWEKVADHPLWKDCYEADGTLIDEMLAKMDRLWAKENIMEMAVIEKHEIRKGDHIRVDFKELDGIKQTCVGVADNQDPEGDWRTQEFGFLTWASSATRIDQIYLVDRPKPPLPTVPGTVFRATEICGVKCDVMVMAVEDTLRGPYVSAARIHGSRWHYASDITAWEPIEVPNA